MYYKIYGEKLKQARKEKGETQKQVAEETKIPCGTLACYETGTREARAIKHIITLSEYYDVSIDWLLGVSDNPERKK